MATEETTLREQAYQTIKQSIVYGERESGTFLSERQLCLALKMSKTPIRSALDRLEMTGLVKLMPNQGFVVQEMPLRTILELYQLRLALETFAVRTLTGRMDRTFFEQLDANLEEQEEAVETRDIKRYVVLDRQFHERIIAGLDNETYSETMLRMQDRFIRAVRTTFDRNVDRLDGSLQEHRQIRLALSGNDSEASVRLITAHIQYVEQIMF